MESRAQYISQNFFDDVLDTLLVRPDTPKEPYCSICDQAYGNVDQKTDFAAIKPSLALLNELPMSSGPFMQEILEPAVSKCGHTFCTSCICLWLASHRNCPTCRIHLVGSHDRHADGSDDNTDSDGDADSDDGSESGDESDSDADFDYDDGLDHEDNRPAFEQFDSYMDKLTIREHLKLKTPMPFARVPNSFVFMSLPRTMVTIARRFHLQATGELAPADMHKMRFKSMPKFDVSDWTAANPDTALAGHSDAIQLYTTIYDCLVRLDTASLRHETRLGAAEETFDTVEAAMPDADGGIDQKRWWAYVECVIKYELASAALQQRYCDLVHAYYVTNRDDVPE